MDAPTRERYLRMVRHLAAHSRRGLDADEIARIALRRAGAADADAPPAAGHVGYHLVGPGAPALEREVGYHPPARVRVYRFLWRHPASVYLGLCSALALALLAPVLAYAARHGAGAGMLALVAAAVLPVAVEGAILLARLFLHPRFPLRVLPKMEFAEAVPDEHRTLLVIPTLLRSPEDARRQVAVLAEMAAEHPGPNLRFALLSDFTDAPRQRMSGDREILTAAREAVRRLNARHHSAVGDRFFVLHRERAWNPDEERWTGWLRKVGKLEELYRLLREPGAETGFRWVFGRLPRAGVGVPFRYVVTVDEGDRLEPGCAADLVRTAAHPLNRPWSTRGWGASRRGTGCCSRLRGPRWRYAAATRTWSMARPLRPAGPTGSPAAPAVLLHGRVRDGAVPGQGAGGRGRLARRPPGCGHPRLGTEPRRAGGLLRQGRQPGGPADERGGDGPLPGAGARRPALDARGLPARAWLFPRVRDGEGRARRNPVPWTLRLRLLRLVLSVFGWPSVLLVLLLGWTVLPGSAWAWTAVALSAGDTPVGGEHRQLAPGGRAPGRGPPRASWRGYLDELLYRGFRVGVLAHWAVLAGDAAARGVWRALVSRRLRTQWTTTQQSTQQPLALGYYLRTMWASVAGGRGRPAAGGRHGPGAAPGGRTLRAALDDGPAVGLAHGPSALPGGPPRPRRRGGGAAFPLYHPRSHR